ncbi:MAG: DUF5710 domain-containing protein [Gammaproteobacteria bacterium]|nr:DUF5710 domain-containing protein [Gammaproteobacteria bacterium]
MSYQPQYLKVDFSEKDAAKALGAQWDRVIGLWFIPARVQGDARRALLERFAGVACSRPSGLPSGDVAPNWCFPGEDRAFGGNGLFVDLVPQGSWFKNARSAISPEHWHAVRTVVLRRTGKPARCEVCGTEAGGDRAMDCHERWEFTTMGRPTQTLKRLMVLCKPCHEATHIGFAQTQMRGGIATEHLAEVNRWTMDQALDHIEAAFDLWEQRNRRVWVLDLGILERAGVTLACPDKIAP